jgi:hypothetical protein
MVQLNVRVDSDFKNLLAAFAQSQGRSMGEVIEQSASEYMNPEGYKKIALRYLGNIDHTNRSQLKRLELIEETLGQFVQLYFFYTPDIPEDAAIRSVSMASARSRFRGFLSLVSKRIRGSKTYRDAFEEVLFAERNFHGCHPKNEGAAE